MGTVRSAFEYGGQKCSACSRMYVPDSMWPQIKQQLLDIHKDIRVGDVSANEAAAASCRVGSDCDSVCLSLTQFDSVCLSLTQFDSVCLSLTQFAS